MKRSVNDIEIIVLTNKSDIKRFDKTLGELDDDIKSKISHRGKALALAKPIIKMLKRK
jgi:hypothetical protein